MEDLCGYVAIMGCSGVNAPVHGLTLPYSWLARLCKRLPELSGRRYGQTIWVLMETIEAFLCSIHCSSGVLRDIQIYCLTQHYWLVQAAQLSFQGVPLRQDSYIRQLFLARVWVLYSSFIRYADGPLNK
jgi:hypothetical protein